MTTLELILAIVLIIFWGCLCVSMLLSTIQSMLYDRKREKRDQEYHAERMKNLK